MHHYSGDCELHSPYMDHRKCGSDQTPFRTLDITHLEPPNMAEEQFLAILRLEEEQRGKLAATRDCPTNR